MLIPLASWCDASPAPEWSALDSHTLVVRDDLLPGGTKVRALDYLIGHDPQFQHVTEWVYGSSPAHGYAQVALPYACGRYQKQAVIFMAARRPDAYHRLQRLGLSLPAARYVWVPNGMLSVTQKRAKDYVSESPETRQLLPMGGNAPSAVAALTQVMQGLRERLPWPPTDIWSIVSSGTLSRALQSAFPEANVHGVVVGHRPTPDEAGRAQLWDSPYRFVQPVKPTEAPPYPSAPEYDAKLWPLYCAWRASHPEARVLIWNVGA